MRTVALRFGLPTACILLGLLTVRNATADTCVCTAAPATKGVGEAANDVASVIANFYGSYQAAMAAAQWLGLLKSPQVLTYDELKDQLNNLGANLIWAADQNELSAINGSVSETMSLAQACAANKGLPRRN